MASLDKTLRQLQSGASADEEAGPDTPARESFAHVNRALATLLEVVEGADAKPTAQALSALEDVDRALTALLAQWSAIESRDLPAVNAVLRQAGLPAVAIERPR